MARTAKTADKNTTPAACPLCGKPASAEHAPFCSATCRDRDLIAWLGGHYIIGSAAMAGDDEEG